jgi:hypothetical protein
MRVVSVAGLIGGVLMLGLAVLYVAILGAQESGLTDETSPWAAALVLLGLAGIVASFLGAPRLAGGRFRHVCTDSAGSRHPVDVLDRQPSPCCRVALRECGTGREHRHRRPAEPMTRVRCTGLRQCSGVTPER